MSRDFTIESVRGRLDETQSEELLAFWAATGALTADQARDRLSEVVCVLRDGDGAIAGVSSAFPTDMALIGGRRFWVFRSLLPGAAGEQLQAMIRATFAALEADFDGSPDAPIGLCALLDPAHPAARTEAEWSDPRMIYAGYLGDGRQARIAYFAGASIGGGPMSSEVSSTELGEDYRVELFADQDRVTAADVIDLWTSEGAVSRAEAERRIGEVLLVGTDAEGRPVGVSSAYLQYNDQLQMDLWYYRAFVAAAHRMSHVAVSLAMTGRDLLSSRFAGGQDTRAAGMIFEVQNEGLKRHYHQARWRPTEFLFINQDARGAHVRVYYFPGARAPQAGGQGRT
ncbi:MAG: hypothetical protein JWM71_761 [Solirubrobacteraceae bacterium]|nr:hypothetical protein [Solirubrobacteraceae bacterium]